MCPVPPGEKRVHGPPTPPADDLNRLYISVLKERGGEAATDDGHGHSRLNELPRLLEADGFRCNRPDTDLAPLRIYTGQQVALPVSVRRPVVQRAEEQPDDDDREDAEPNDDAIAVHHGADASASSCRRSMRNHHRLRRRTSTISLAASSVIAGSLTGTPGTYRN